MTYFKDLTGQVFGEWKVLKLSEYRKENNFWFCECSCGKVHEVSSASLLHGHSSKCKSCARRGNGKRNRKPDIISVVSKLYSCYKHGAKIRNYCFNLTKEEFENLIFKDCYYCGVRPNNVFVSYNRKNDGEHSPYMYNGIDRVDNTRGYELDNCVPCCAICNSAKSTLTRDQFLSWVKSIYIKQYYGISEKTLGVLADELSVTNIKCFMAQEDIKNKELTPEKQLEAAKKSQELNKRRNELIRAVDSILGFENSPTEKTY